MSEAGIQVYNDDGIFQIDGTTPHITLLRKGTVIGGATSGLYSGNLSVAMIPIATGEILAISTATPAVLWCRYQGNAYLITPGATNASIDYWVFSKHQPSGLNYGMQVYDSAATLIYDTGRPTLNVVGTYEGQGSTQSYDATKVAVIPWQTYARTWRFIVYTNVGTNPDFMAFNTSYAGCVSTSGRTVTCTNTLVFQNGSGPYDTDAVFPSNWVLDETNGLENRFAVIDVTNL